MTDLVISGDQAEDLSGEVRKVVRPRRMTPLHAGAIRFDGAHATATERRAVQSICEPNLVDHAFVPSGLRISDLRLLAIDMDSTLITIECIDEIADLIGKRAEVAAITNAAMRGEFKDFSMSLRTRVAELAGAPTAVLARAYEERLKLSPGTTELIVAARSANVYTLLLSGGFSYFTDRLAAELRLDEAHSNNLQVQDDVLTGYVSEPILDALAKADYVAKAVERLKCDRNHVLAIGDGANDIPMMKQAGYSVAYRAHEATRAAATFQINYGTLATILDYLSYVR